LFSFIPSNKGAKFMPNRKNDYLWFFLSKNLRSQEKIQEMSKNFTESPFFY